LSDNELNQVADLTVLPSKYSEWMGTDGRKRKAEVNL